MESLGEKGSQAVAGTEFDPAKHTYKVPVKKIDDPMTHEAFKRSEAC